MKRLRLLAGLAVACAVGLAVYLTTEASRRLEMTPLSSVRAEGLAPPLEGAVEWLNSGPLNAAQLRGKVVLVNFWTYSCINWHRTLPHVRAWADKYKAQGLVVVGVHTPEFGFEKDVPRIREAMAQLQVHYPVAVDSNFAIWRAFRNSAWPAIYIVDAQGRLRYRHRGEGEFEHTEAVIQQLLAEAGAKDVPGGRVQVRGVGSQAQADWDNLRSPETYVGYERTHGFGSPGGLARERERDYEPPQRIRLNTWGLAGKWRAGPEAARLQGQTGRVFYGFHARDVHLVMGPPAGGAVPFRVLIDGKPPGAAHGADVDAEGRGLLVEHRLYQLVRQAPGPVHDRQVEIEFLAPGVEVFAFTFG